MAIEKKDSLVILFEGLPAQVERLQAGLSARGEALQAGLPARNEGLQADALNYILDELNVYLRKRKFAGRRRWRRRFVTSI